MPYTLPGGAYPRRWNIMERITQRTREFEARYPESFRLNQERKEMSPMGFKPGQRLKLNARGQELINEGGGSFLHVSKEEWRAIFNRSIIVYEKARPECGTDYGHICRLNFIRNATTLENTYTDVYDFAEEYLEPFAPALPYTSNTLGDFPKKEGCCGLS